MKNFNEKHPHVIENVGCDEKFAKGVSLNPRKGKM